MTLGWWTVRAAWLVLWRYGWHALRVYLRSLGYGRPSRA